MYKPKISFALGYMQGLGNAHKPILTIQHTTYSKAIKSIYIMQSIKQKINLKFDSKVKSVKNHKA